LGVDEGKVSKFCIIDSTIFQRIVGLFPTKKLDLNIKLKVG
jgi:hypothetical protein